jgi:hypothetical protein
MTTEPLNPSEETTHPETTHPLLAAVHATFPLTVEGDPDSIKFNSNEYIQECIRQLPSSVTYNGGTYYFDGGDLGSLEIELDELDLDLEDLVNDHFCGDAPDYSEYMSNSNDVGQTTLKAVREAWMAHTGRSAEDYLWGVVVEAMGAARNDEAKVGSSHHLELVEEQVALRAQAAQDRNKAQAEYGKADRDRQRLEADLKWATEVIGTLQVADAIQEKAAGLVRVIEDAQQARQQALSGEQDDNNSQPTEEAQA